MTVKRKRKKWLLSVIAVILTAALGVGIWLGTQGGGEPVNVYPFQYIGMTEFWGDMQESYGPVTTDKIQTEFLSDTQTVTEVKVKDGDTVKKGDVLFTFDTTLDALSLERKRLEVEKIKVQIEAAEERLQETREMVPYVPPELEESEEETDLGEELTEPYKIFPLAEDDEKVYTGKSKETALICWLKDGMPITDDLLQKLYETAKAYQLEAPQEPELSDEKVDSSASDVPGADNEEDILTQEQEHPRIKIYPFCGKTEMEPYWLVEKQDSQKYVVPDTYTYNDGGTEKTYWILSAKRKSDDVSLGSLEIPGYPEDVTAQEEWNQVWGDGIIVNYMRSVEVNGERIDDSKLTDINDGDAVQVGLNSEIFAVITTKMENKPENTTHRFEVSPQNGILKVIPSSHRDDILVLYAKPEEVTKEPVPYTIRTFYSYPGNQGQERAVAETIRFTLEVVEEPRVKEGEFFVVFKTTDKNYLKGTKTLWQGAQVTAYDGTFDMLLYDPNSVTNFADHTIEQEVEIEIDLPEIDPNQMYTAEQILDMQKQCYATIKEQEEKLKLAENEFSVMEREMGDGNIYAEIDGKVVSLLTEDEAREQKQPIIKVSGGGGFYIEGSVSELEKEKLKIGQEVTVNDWNTGSTYTGEVVSIGEFPSDDDNWNGMGNPTASYYPFKAFVGEEADLRAGSYVSMSYSTASAEQGIYLEKAFVRTEKGESYIFVRGADGRLEKRIVRLGKVLWGSYYEILSPLGEEDLLAFPYGKNVKAGAPTVESDLSTLYTY